MKITEIIDTKITDTKTDGVHYPHEIRAQFDDRTSKDKDVKIKSGQYGYVVPDDKDPHMVDKFYKNVIKTQDGYHTYINGILDLMGNNTYAPRVYNVKNSYDLRGANVPEFKMEKLHPISELTPEEAEHVYDMAINDIHFDMDTSSFIDNYGHTELLHRIHRMIQNAIFYEDYSEIKDDNLKELLGRIVKILADNNNLSLDLHLENYMFRRTPTGAQLVITDPIN